MRHSNPSADHSMLADDRLAFRTDFSTQFENLVRRSQIQSADIEIPSEEDTLRALELVGAAMPVANCSIVRSIYRHNPECFRIVWSGSLAQSPMMTYLPLNAEGAAALVDHRFDAKCPDLHYICAPGEQPEAIYIWLMFTPGKMIAGLRFIKELEKYGNGAPIFARPVHDELARILKMSGFVPAREFFPAAPADLVFTLSTPLGLGETNGRKTITIRVARSFEDMAKIFSVRTATYMCEQLCSFDEEFDGNDFSATHLLGEVRGEPAGCVRIRYFGEFAKLERLAVRPEFRRSRLMRELAREALDFCARKGFSKIYGHVRLDLVPAWEKMFGAKPVEGRSAFSFSDVNYREMEFDLPRRNDAIHFGSDPFLTIRPEGDWDRLGPIEKAQFIRREGRKGKIGGLRQFGN